MLPAMIYLTWLFPVNYINEVASYRRGCFYRNRQLDQHFGRTPSSPYFDDHLPRSLLSPIWTLLTPPGFKHPLQACYIIVSTVVHSCESRTFLAKRHYPVIHSQLQYQRQPLVIRLNISQHKENSSIFLSQVLIFFFHGKRGIILVKQVSQIMSLIKTVYFCNPISKLTKYKARNVQKTNKTIALDSAQQKKLNPNLGLAMSLSELQWFLGIYMHMVCEITHCLSASCYMTRWTGWNPREQEGDVDLPLLSTANHLCLCFSQLSKDIFPKYSLLRPTIWSVILEHFNFQNTIKFFPLTIPNIIWTPRIKKYCMASNEIFIMKIKFYHFSDIKIFRLYWFEICLLI